MDQRSKMLIDAIRSLVPIRIRQDLGLWTILQAGRSKFLLYPYFLFLCGKVPKNLNLLPDGTCYVEYEGTKVYAPRDGILAFVEVFQDKIYEKYGRPKKGDIVVDVGAYVGMFTVRASKLVGEKGTVTAVEPESTNLGLLRKNIQGLDNVEVLPIAASNKTCWGKLAISRASACHTLTYNHAKTIDVQISTLDAVLKLKNIKKIDFLKIDAEGSELDILEGTRGFLEGGNVRMAIAVYHLKDEPKKVRAYLEGLGYRVILDKGYIYAEKTT